MLLHSNAMRIAAFGVATSVAFASLPIAPAPAALVGTEAAIRPVAPAEARDKIDALLHRDDVRKQFVDWGVDPEEAATRVAALNDNEVVTLSARLDQTESGRGAVGAVVGAAIIVVIILVFTDIAGVTDVFTFINKN